MPTLRNQAYVLLVITVLILLGALASVSWWPKDGPATADSRNPYAGMPATYVGRGACIDCHEPQHKLWVGSHHDLAMQPANDQTVLGDFNDASFTHFGTTSKFYKRDGRFFVYTDGPDGEMREFEIAFTFGVTPLQQYLIAFPDGRYQALGICWDTRPAEKGGQRWYHLYADEPIPHDDELHWTGPNQNWNFMCAECHSTNLQKGYDLATDSYNTTWSEINVSCEACHGPGSNHVRWAKEYERGIDRGDATMGLAFVMPDDGGVWEFAPDAVTAQRSKPRVDHPMIQMCARCHSRRSVIAEDYRFGQDIMDTHRPELLLDGLYFADGQIRDEVYVYGSFLQSKMYQKGVTCTDCHDPHSMRILSPGNTLCSKCHLPQAFDTPEHHFHEQGTDESRCVACHMPTRTYMGVDERLDHSIRIPRPDLTVRIGTPNACNKCHDDQTAQWAADAVVEWYGPNRRRETHYGKALHAGRNLTPDANGRLVDLARDTDQPGIVRATAMLELQNYPSRLSYETILAHAHDQDPLIRRAALSALDMMDPVLRLPIAMDLLDDPVLAVRLEAGRILAPADTSQLGEPEQQAVTQGIENYIRAQLVNADRAESHLNIGLVRMQQGRTEQAEDAYRTAIRINPAFAQAYVNLADLYRVTDRDASALGLLQGAVDAGVDQGAIHYALGLTLVRLGRTNDALQALDRAVQRSPHDPQFGYTLGIALNSTGQRERALKVLGENHERHPADQATLLALMTINRDHGNLEAATGYARKLLALNPDNAPAIEAFIRELQAQTKPNITR